jgi:hypothetical protein
MFLRDRIRELWKKEVRHVHRALTSPKSDYAKHMVRARPYGNHARDIMMGKDGPRYIK